MNMLKKHVFGSLNLNNSEIFRLSFEDIVLGTLDTYMKTICTRGVRVVFSATRMRSSNSARMNKFDFNTEKIGSMHMTVFEIVAHRNVDNWIQLLT